jgi:hypothetical protein
MTTTRDFPIFNQHWTRASIARWSIKAERDRFSQEQQVEITCRLLEAAERFGIQWDPPEIAD